MLYNKKIVILISVLIFLFSTLLVVNFFLKTQTTDTQPLDIPTFDGSPSPSTVSSSVKQSVVYDTVKLNKDFERIINKAGLSEQDKKVRQELINSVSDKSGLINTNQLYSIEYVKSPDSFMVEILSTDVEAAKKSAASWFKQKGISGQGICNLPVVFYLNDSVKSYLQQNNQTFNPLPEECK